MGRWWLGSNCPKSFYSKGDMAKAKFFVLLSNVLGGGCLSTWCGTLTLMIGSCDCLPYIEPSHVNSSYLSGTTYNPFWFDYSCRSFQSIKYDLLLISQYAQNIRTYGLGCGHEAAILTIAAQLNISVTLGDLNFR